MEVRQFLQNEAKVHIFIILNDEITCTTWKKICHHTILPNKISDSSLLIFYFFINVNFSLEMKFTKEMTYI